MKSDTKEVKLSTRKTHLLVIDDDPLFRAQIQYYARHDYDVEESSSAHDIDPKSLIHADIVVLDLNMPKTDGIEFIKTLSTISPAPKLLIASGYDRKIIDMAKHTAELYGLKDTAVLHKPFSHHEFADTLKSLMKNTANNAPTVSRTSISLSGSENEITNGLRAGEFLPYYQPQVSLTSQEVIGLEALARWNHPIFGILTPAVFIETIETSKLAHEFTIFIIEQSIQDYLEFHNQIGYRGRISVNVPPTVFASSSFTQAVLDLIVKYDFPTDKLMLEITERGIEKMEAEIVASLTRLSMNGILLSVDDFGTGQSGLSKLKSGIFDEIKLDRSFIIDLENSRKSTLIVESVLNLASLSGLEVVAEGVEDWQTARALKYLGCEIVQGFLFAKPMSKEKLLSWIPAHRLAVQSDTNDNGDKV